MPDAHRETPEEADRVRHAVRVNWMERELDDLLAKRAALDVKIKRQRQIIAQEKARNAGEPYSGNGFFSDPDD